MSNLRDLDRFISKIRITDDCWPWQGTKHNVGGYGRFRFPGRFMLAHRQAYEFFVGPIPEGMTLDHLCRNRACVRPDHLEPVTRSENARRGHRNAAKTACPQGHPYVGDNLYVTPGGVRQCRACAAARRVRS